MLKKGQITLNIVDKCFKTHLFDSPVFNDYKYSLFLKRILHDCPAFWQFSTRKVRISEGTFCHVDVHIRLLNDWAMLNQQP